MLNQENLRKADRPYIDCIKEILKPLGYKQYVNTWRQEFDETYVLCKVDYCTLSYDVGIVFAVWIKGIKEIKLTELQHGMGAAHGMSELSSSLPKEYFYKYIAAQAVENRDFDWEINHYAANYPQRKGYILDAFKNKAPYTLEQKLKIYRECFIEFGLPYLESLKTKEGVRSLVFDKQQFIAMDIDAARFLNIPEDEFFRVNFFPGNYFAQ